MNKIQKSRSYNYKSSKVKSFPYKTTKQVKMFVVTCLLMISMMLTGCQTVDMDESISDSRFMIGTIVTLQLFGTTDMNLLDESFAIIEEIDSLMSLSIDSSELNGLNNNAGKGPYVVSEKTFYVIQKAL